MRSGPTPTLYKISWAVARAPRSAALAVIVPGRVDRHRVVGIDLSIDLGSAMSDPGHLHRMQPVRRTDALDSGDPGAIGQPFHLGRTGPDHLAVDDDAAGPALPLAILDLGAGKGPSFL